MSGTVKNCHSPAGMHFASPKGYANLTDCPSCRYGTLDKMFNINGNFIGARCIDCCKVFTKQELSTFGIFVSNHQTKHMNEPTTTAVGDASPNTSSGNLDSGTSTGLTTQSNEWDLAAEQQPNKDAYVPVSDPMFNEQTIVAEIVDVEKVAANQDGKGEAVKVGFKTEGELVSLEGIKRAPGFVWKPRFPYTLQPPSEKEEGQAEMGRRNVAKLAIALGLIRRGANPTIGELYRTVGKMKGRKVKLAFTTSNGKKRDPETGEFVKFQNVDFASVESNGGAGHAGGGTSNGLLA